MPSTLCCSSNTTPTTRPNWNRSPRHSTRFKTTLSANITALVSTLADDTLPFSIDALSDLLAEHNDISSNDMGHPNPFRMAT